MSNAAADLAHIGATIKQAREAAGRTQRSLAAAVGILQPRWPDLERGKYRLSADQLVRIAAELDLTLEELTPTPVAEAAAS